MNSTTQTTTKSKKMIYVQYGIILLAFIVSAIIAYFALTDPASLENEAFRYFLLIIVPFILAIVSISFLFYRENVNTTSMFARVGTAGIIIVLLLGLAYIYTSHSWQFFQNGILRYILLFLIIIFGLSFLYSIFFTSITQYTNNNNDVISISLQIFFFIPCMITDFLQYIRIQYEITPNEITILLLLEVVLILMYLYLPRIGNKIAEINTVFLMPDAAFLNIKQVISNSEPMILNNIVSKSLTDTEHETNFRENYGLSMWIYINDYDKTRNRTQTFDIFQYGDGKPFIQYEKNQLKMQMSNSTLPSAPPILHLTVELQKWNFLAINYANNKADVFLNGRLNKSCTFTTENIPTFTKADIVSIGETGGIDGAICNIMYYLFPMTASNVAQQYNMLSYSNPPVYSITQITELEKKQTKAVKTLENIVKNKYNTTYDWIQSGQ